MRLTPSILVLFALLLMTIATASEFPRAEIIKLRGEVLFNNQIVKAGDVIKDKGSLVTKDNSFVQLKIELWKNNISLGPASSMEINFDSEKNYTLAEGTARWKTFGKSESKGKIYTNSVSMGVRGTDFWMKKNSILNESEIIMFEGEVVMGNSRDPKNTVLIFKGQWGGMGGRYGQKIAPPITLPLAVLEGAEKSLE